MGKKFDDRHLIDRFLQGELTGIEKENFTQRVSEDEGFRRDLELHKTIYSGIQIANHERLKGIIQASLNYRKPTIPFGLKMIVTFLVVTGIGITLWFYVGNESVNKEQTKSWFAFLKSKKNEDKETVETPKQKPQGGSKPVKGTATKSSKENSSALQPDSSWGEVLREEPKADSLENPQAEEEIIVKQDQLMIGVKINVEDKDEEGGPGKSDQMSADALLKLNPGADLPEEEKAPASYDVEFWISPVNYKGYKMSKNKLILFGIDEPDAVKLYRVKEALYMVYLKEYYRLNSSFDFMSYQKLKDSEIPLAIR